MNVLGHQGKKMEGKRKGERKKRDRSREQSREEEDRHRIKKKSRDRGYKEKLYPKYCSGLPFPSPGDLPDPGIEPRSPARHAGSRPLSHQWSLLQNKQSGWGRGGVVGSGGSPVGPGYFGNLVMGTWVERGTHDTVLSTCRFQSSP